MSTTTSIHEHAVEVDTRLSDAYLQLFGVGSDIKHEEDNIRRIAGQTYDWRITKEWSGTFAEAVAFSDFASEWQAKGHDEAILKRYALLDKRTELQKTITECNADWYANGCWSRFYLVCNSNGHIHSSVNCSTCYDTTQYAWLTNLSGLTEADAVEAEGEILCTICFPSAPVSWTNGISRRDKEAKAQREAEKAERQRKKAEKSLSLDGEIVKITVSEEEKVKRCHGRWKEFKTLRSAELWLVEAYAYNLALVIPEDKRWGFYAPEGYSEANVLYVVDLYAQKTGTSTDDVIANAIKKAGKKVKEGNY
jgi:hypothetical protein